MGFNPTKLDYYDNMWKRQSEAILLSFFKSDNGRLAMVLDSTIFYPQGGGQPFDTGFISTSDSERRFRVQDVRSKDGVVFHYGVVEGSAGEGELEQQVGKKVLLFVDESRRKLNSRLHSAGHLLDVCTQNVGLGHLEPGKAYHFSDGPFVEYKGIIPQHELPMKQKELESKANELISKGCKVSVAIVPYEEAVELCGGSVPEYIPKGSNPRIVTLGDNPGCPCGGTHVSDISEIISMKVSQIKVKKGVTKIYYEVGS